MIYRDEEKLRATEAFGKYTDCPHEFQPITDYLIIPNSFKMGVEMMLEVMEK